MQSSDGGGECDDSGLSASRAEGGGVNGAGRYRGLCTLQWSYSRETAGLGRPRSRRESFMDRQGRNTQHSIRSKTQCSDRGEDGGWEGRRECVQEERGWAEVDGAKAGFEQRRLARSAQHQRRGPQMERRHYAVCAAPQPGRGGPARNARGPQPIRALARRRRAASWIRMASLLLLHLAALGQEHAPPPHASPPAAQRRSRASRAPPACRARRVAPQLRVARRAPPPPPACGSVGRAARPSIAQRGASRCGAVRSSSAPLGYGGRAAARLNVLSSQRCPPAAAACCSGAGGRGRLSGSSRARSNQRLAARRSA